MGMYDYCSSEKFVELVRKCYLDLVDLSYTAEDFDREESVDFVRGMTVMAKSLIYAIEKDRE